MSFSPIIPMSGYGGWAFLQRTMDQQRTTFDQGAALQRDEAYFRDKIGSIRSAAELVGDHRLMKVALGAFGLDNDLPNKFFIRKVLEDGTLDPKALANRLSDKNYLEMSKAFGFGDFSTPRTVLSDFADQILTKYRERQFEVAVGTQNNDMRLALSAQRELPKIAASGSTDAQWFRVLGSAPLRQVFQTAFGLPTSFGAIDLDQQLGVMKSKAKQMFGTDQLAKIAAPDQMDKLIRRYLVMSDTATAPTGPASAALQILQRGGAANILSLLR
ncbi:DUF1217 domain-containing protein [Falsirhodobacter halotolerans]|uniref:DUF1217 domain-containing protein n=1 Tax=Falsirhodobacter halotolerans TaxID=1146892 RepID=UPI001FD46D57|nr:DUF1217 domain-containing protein [Falsirhodobacter halotolerans]MCJ8140567.1 DUF1217 domain-containing protein [Falsirhodobacter halotolerans]